MLVKILQNSCKIGLGVERTLQDVLIGTALNIILEAFISSEITLKNFEVISQKLTYKSK